MATAVLPHAQTLPAEVELHRIPAHLADQFTALMERADQAISLYEIRPLHAQAAQVIGLQLPDSQDIALCTCTCLCDRVFDANLARTHLDGTVERVQCPVCADEHRLTGDE
ncbi:hypothetical protein [Streptomyces sp. NPDC060366]|uniref:hypothetical protein n=1 Tax=Streptomyces sp. NPDC060366 TaxID=3347105 RepID=UPI00365939B6